MSAPFEPQLPPPPAEAEPYGPTTSSFEVDQLLARAQAGDMQARAELFERCRSYVAILARARVESWLQAKVDSSDLVQQTMLDAFRAFDQFRGQTRGEWLAWLRRILETRATDAVRAQGAAKRRVSREVSLDSPQAAQADASGFRPWEPTDDGDSPSQALQRVEDQLALAEAMEQLTEDHREVIILRNLQRLSFNEVAERMGRTRPAVQMLWMRAIRHLQELLADRR